MKFLASILFLIVYSVLAQTFEEFGDSLNDDDCKQEGLDCLNDDQLIVCQNFSSGFKEIAKVSCSSSFDSTYCCSNKACTNEDCGSSGEIPDQKPKPVCIKEGVFPSPINCSSYYICDNDLTAIEGSCECANFNATLGKCHTVLLQMEEACNNESNCDLPSLNCTDPFVSQVFPDDKQYYAYCINYEEFVVDKCEDGLIFAEEHNECLLLCPGVGNFPDSTECRKYYYCDKIGEVGKIESCGEGMVFDPDTDGCEPETALNACNNRRSTTEHFLNNKINVI